VSQRTLDGVDITTLRATYRRRVTQQLPAAAAEAGSWPIQSDHCFARVVLDNVFGGEWYDHVDGRPAYEHLAAAELRAAIAIADRMLRDGRPTVVALNDASLQWRGKLD
jgi:proline racemase